MRTEQQQGTVTRVCTRKNQHTSFLNCVLPPREGDCSLWSRSAGVVNAGCEAKPSTCALVDIGGIRRTSLKSIMIYLYEGSLSATWKDRLMAHMAAIDRSGHQPGLFEIASPRYILPNLISTSFSVMIRCGPNQEYPCSLYQSVDLRQIGPTRNPFSLQLL